MRLLQSSDFFLTGGHQVYKLIWEMVLLPVTRVNSTLQSLNFSAMLSFAEVVCYLLRFVFYDDWVIKSDMNSVASQKMAHINFDHLYPNGPKSVVNVGILTRSKKGKAVRGLTKGKIRSGVITNNTNHHHRQQLANLQVLSALLRFFIARPMNCHCNE
jgi:hypothetical protein